MSLEENILLAYSKKQGVGKFKLFVRFIIWIRRKVVRIMFSKIDKEIKLETLCLVIAGFNMIVRLIYLVLAVIGHSETLNLLTLPDPPESYGPSFKTVLRPLLIIDSIVSLIFTAILIIGVKKYNHRLLKVCYSYGMVVLSLSVLGTIPSIVKKITNGDWSNMGRQILALLAIVICALELLVVYKTYRKFYHNGERIRLFESSHGEMTLLQYKNCHSKEVV